MEDQNTNQQPVDSINNNKTTPSNVPPAPSQTVQPETVPNETANVSPVQPQVVNVEPSPSSSGFQQADDNKYKFKPSWLLYYFIPLFIFALAWFLYAGAQPPKNYVHTSAVASNSSCNRVSLTFKDLNGNTNTIAFHPQGRTCQGNTYSNGEHVAISYNPNNPDNNVKVESSVGIAVAVTIGLLGVFMLVTVTVIIHNPRRFMLNKSR